MSYEDDTHSLRLEALKHKHDLERQIRESEERLGEKIWDVKKAQWNQSFWLLMGFYSLVILIVISALALGGLIKQLH